MEFGTRYKEAVFSLLESPKAITQINRISGFAESITDFKDNKFDVRKDIVRSLFVLKDLIDINGKFPTTKQINNTLNQKQITNDYSEMTKNFVRLLGETRDNETIFNTIMRDYFANAEKQLKDENQSLFKQKKKSKEQVFKETKENYLDELGEQKEQEQEFIEEKDRILLVSADGDLKKT